MESTMDVYAEELKLVEKGVEKLENILDGRTEESPFTSEEYMKLYTTIYNICTVRKVKDCIVYLQPEMYEKYQQLTENHITSKVLPPLDGKHDEFILREMAKRWSLFKVFEHWLSRFFDILDRFYVGRCSLKHLQPLAFSCFNSSVLFKRFSGRVRDAVICLIDDEREGAQIDRALLKSAVDMFVEIEMGGIELYEKDFEAFMLAASVDYYSRKASEWIQQDSCPAYMVKAEECLKREKERVENYLQPSSEEKLLKKVEHELLSVPQSQLLEKEHSGVYALLRDGMVDDLSRMFRLFSRVEHGLNAVSQMYLKYVTDVGNALVKQAEDDATNKAKKDAACLSEHVFVTKVIELHDTHLGYVTTSCFQNHSLFHKALKEAFQEFCNKSISGCLIAEVFSKFFDNLLKKGGNEKLSHETIEGTLGKVVKLLAYISDKDLFTEFCRKRLAKRLLFDRSANDNHERYFLSKLKQQCGGQFTSKMEGMLTDLTLGRENQMEYEEYLNSNPQLSRPGIDFGVTVLTTGFWPTYKSSDLSVPIEMEKCIQSFKDFYQNKAKRRKLNWINSLGSANVVGKFESKSIEMVVTTYQAAVLLLFNDSKSLSYSEIVQQLNLKEDDVVRILHSLSCSKYKILNKLPKTKTISSDDHFEFNAKFTDKMQRIRIPLLPSDERKKVIEDVDNDRRYTIDAALVRIMKSRKVLGDQQLVSECVQQLSHMFKPDFKLIKKRIEELIDREYMERDTENPNLLKYLA